MPDKLLKNSPVTAIYGCGRKKADQLAVLGIYTAGDLLRHFPRGYLHKGDVRELSENNIGKTASFVLTVTGTAVTSRIPSGKLLTKCKAFDGMRSCTLVYYNQKYIKSVLIPGNTYRFWGKLTRGKSGFILNPLSTEPVTASKKLAEFVPVYPLTNGLTQGSIRLLINFTLDNIEIGAGEFMPTKVREELSLCSEAEAYRYIHKPENEQMIERGRHRFLCEELFVLALTVRYAKRGRQLLKGKKFSTDKCAMNDFYEVLPFRLTDAQTKVTKEITNDLTSGNPMARLISGDVGSGKTVCAMAAAFMSFRNGYQTAVMAPTEILARQHFKDFCSVLQTLDIECVLLVGSMSRKEKAEALEKIADGSAGVIIGTHALLSENVAFSGLGLVITDEQHRFGVAQRASLQSKGDLPHVLVMSATPIPRTLALILMGDLDISVIDRMPAGRQKTDTFVVSERYRQRLNGFIAKQVQQGHQVYIVCPSVEAQEDPAEDSENESDFIPFAQRSDYAETEKMPELKNVTEYEANLKNNVFPEFRTALIHGKLSGAEKDKIMSDFADGKTDILVSTTVIEVGINVPNATLMIVENAERFGLSQLHQLRGRVGRGSSKSYCILVSDSKSESARKRLDAMRTTYDGYRIAKYDLELRGPGDFISLSADGVGEKMRQHGNFGTKIAELCSDQSLLNKIFEIADSLLERDPQLDSEENRILKQLLVKTDSAVNKTLN